MNDELTDDQRAYLHEIADYERDVWRNRDANVKSAIAAELYIALERLEAPPELLSIVGGWGDSLKDEEVLSALKDWNDFGVEAQQIIAE